MAELGPVTREESGGSAAWNGIGSPIAAPFHSDATPFNSVVAPFGSAATPFDSASSMRSVSGFSSFSGFGSVPAFGADARLTSVGSFSSGFGSGMGRALSDPYAGMSIAGTGDSGGATLQDGEASSAAWES